MNSIKLSLKNLLVRPGRLFLTVVMLTVGVALSSLSTFIETGLRQGLEKNIRDIDIVVGAKGSPAQLVFSSVYHLSALGGNINRNEVIALAENRLVDNIVEIFFGDSYRSSRIVGTTYDFLDLYDASIQKGRLWNRTFEVVLGSQAALENDINIGDLIYTTHGTDGLGYTHEEFPLVVVGILKPTQLVVDKLILTDLETMWEVHSNQNYGLEDFSDNKNLEVTAAFIKLKQKNAKMSVLRTISQQTHLQAAVPADEYIDITKALKIANRVLQNLAALFVILGVISILIFMMSSVKEGMAEIALMRVMGASRNQIFLITILEGFFIGLIVVVFGILIAHLAMGAINPFIVREFGTGISVWSIKETDTVLITSVISMCILATLIPAIIASRTNVSSSLNSNGK